VTYVSTHYSLTKEGDQSRLSQQQDSQRGLEINLGTTRRSQHTQRGRHHTTQINKKNASSPTSKDSPLFTNVEARESNQHTPSPSNCQIPSI